MVSFLQLNDVKDKKANSNYGGKFMANSDIFIKYT
jgi:hypothetical protein